MSASSALPVTRPLRGARLALALTFALMLSDFLVRSVMAGVLPAVKAEWRLSDAALGVLLGIVPLLVGLLAWPISRLADRWGHVRSITVMATVWCVATLLCGVSQSHAQLLMARALVGVGEAAYGSVGAALLAGLFPPEKRAGTLGLFASAAVLGTVLGVALGGLLAQRYGWRWAFLATGSASLLLVAAFALLVRAPPLQPRAPERSLLSDFRALLAPRSALAAYIGQGLQLFVASAFAAWLPSFFVRDYGMPADQAAVRAAAIFLVVGIGMVGGGVLADRLARRRLGARFALMSAYAALTFVAFGVAFLLPPGAAQIALIVAGALVLTAGTGVANAAVLDVTPRALSATALGTGVLFSNLIGQAPGAVVAGRLSDALGLAPALALCSLAALAAALVFHWGGRHYARDAAAAATA
jgi:predicted MFS family arabinose efflux permease